MRLIKTICLDEESFQEAINEAAKQPLVVVDTEFHKEEQWGKARIIGVSWGFPQGSDFLAFYAPFRHGEFPTVINLDPTLIGEFSRLSGVQVYHNFVADYQVFMHDGVDVSKHYVYDTMVAAHLVDENERSFSLDALSLKYFKARKANLKDLEKDFRWDQIHPLVMGEYACIDVFLTYRQYLRTRAGLQQQELENLYEDYQLFIKTLARIVGRGLHIDEKLARKLQEEGLKELRSIESKLGFNPGSQQRVGKALHEMYGVPVRFRTKKGAPSTSSLHLRRYSDLHPEVKEFVGDVLRYRSTSKSVSTWYQGFLDKRATDGLLHPGLTIVGGGSDDTGGTVTGRLSCREPNLQQIPRRGAARSLFVDPPGYRLMEFDYSQAELRLIGYFLEKVGDSTVADAYRHSLDIHSITAEKMRLTESMPYKDARQVGKTCNFSLCYRAGAEQLKTILYRDGGLDVSQATAKEWHAAWHASYPGVTELCVKAQRQAERLGYVKYWNGRRRHFPEKQDCFKAFNSIIQGGVGQILVYALIELEKRSPSLQIVNTVHDSIWVYVKEEEVDAIVPMVVQCMEEIPTQQFGIPFKVDHKFYTE